MKILFSVYKEDYDTEETILMYSKWILTNWSIEQINKYIELYDGFHCDLVVGQTLSFWDIYCFFDDYESLISKINEIPNAEYKESVHKPCTILRVSNYDPGSADEFDYPLGNRYFLYELSRYECGASGYEALVYWASTHPLEMMFLGGVIYDLCKAVIKLIFRLLKKELPSWPQKRPMYFKVKSFYNNFAKLTQIKQSDCQIVKFKRMKTGVFSVTVRTSMNEKYIVKCNANGRIESLDNDKKK